MGDLMSCFWESSAQIRYTASLLSCIDKGALQSLVIWSRKLIRSHANNLSRSYHWLCEAYIKPWLF
jgi:hypothetical protein